MARLIVSALSAFTALLVFTCVVGIIILFYAPGASRYLSPSPVEKEISAQGGAAKFVFSDFGDSVSNLSGKYLSMVKDQLFFRPKIVPQICEYGDESCSCSQDNRYPGFSSNVPFETFTDTIYPVTGSWGYEFNFDSYSTAPNGKSRFLVVLEDDLAYWGEYPHVFSENIIFGETMYSDAGLPVCYIPSFLAPTHQAVCIGSAANHGGLVNPLGTGRITNAATLKVRQQKLPYAFADLESATPFESDSMIVTPENVIDSTRDGTYMTVASTPEKGTALRLYSIITKNSSQTISLVSAISSKYYPVVVSIKSGAMSGVETNRPVGTGN